MLFRSVGIALGRAADNVLEEIESNERQTTMNRSIFFIDHQHGIYTGIPVCSGCRLQVMASLGYVGLHGEVSLRMKRRLGFGHIWQP